MSESVRLEEKVQLGCIPLPVTLVGNGPYHTLGRTRQNSDRVRLPTSSAVILTVVSTQRLPALDSSSEEVLPGGAGSVLRPHQRPHSSHGQNGASAARHSL